jgi:UDP:flavonoid glycosyltransferase YjiC (YdhE family)
MMESLKQKDIELFNWLEEALKNKEEVVYISIGSIAYWQLWSIDAIYNGLKQVGCKVIWALKEDWYTKIDKTIMKDPKFWIRPFVP